MIRTATISHCGNYRYDLTRRWSDGKCCAFVGLNPSTADETEDDPTIRRCIGFAREWGFGRLVMLNAYAFRATDPRLMKMAADPVGPENNEYLTRWANHCSLIVACWGVNIDPFRQLFVRALFGRRLHVLRLTQDGYPGHPLYLPKTTQPVPWKNGTA